MATQTQTKLNWLEKELPEGLLVDASWLSRHDFSTALRSQYVAAGWLDQPARRVYRRPPRGPLVWQQVVISLQTLLKHRLVVGGRTALELHGFAHYLSQTQKEVHLYGPKPPPNWLHKLPLSVRFDYHNERKLFRSVPVTPSLATLSWNLKTGEGINTDPIHGSLTVQPWGQWEWPLTVTTPERAVLELLDELPARESFHQVDKLFEGLANLGPRRLQALLVDCKSVKVKRLFFFFADRHEHSWLRHIDRNSVDLGKGKRMLVKGGRFDPKSQLTVPEDLDAVQ